MKKQQIHFKLILPFLLFTTISMMLLMACNKSTDEKWEFIEFDLTGIQATANKSTHTYEIRVPKEGADFVFQPQKTMMTFWLSTCWQYNDSHSLLKTGRETAVQGDWFQAHIEDDKNEQGYKYRSSLHVHIDPLNKDKNVDENGNRKMKIGLGGAYVFADLLFIQ
jgi:hypothetical protein